MKAEKMTMSINDSVSIKAGSFSQILATEAMISTIAPIKSQRPRPEKSRFETVAMVANVAKIAPVPPNASMMSDAPFEKPSMKLSRRESIRPMKKVNPSNKATPMPLFLKRSIANMKPNAMPINNSMLMPGLVADSRENPAETPSHAPKTVGAIEAANNQ